MANASPQTVPQGLARSAQALAAAKMEIATDCWLELVAYPAGTARSLWLKTASGWKNHDDPTPNVEAAVMEACKNDNYEIRVWFDGSKVVGLVVNSK
ncbi:MAG: hypothetical protein DHS20C18_34650 [Saprospiraceae bacterium]|nr:MAG: hypothetical protein DHS20C18_34650 [Saprospiraceae bacterium]